MLSIIIRLNDKCQPEFRGALYEDPLHKELQALGVGMVDGGGSGMTANGEIAFCDLNACLVADKKKHIDFLIDSLNKLGAPKGSRLLVGPGREIPFGVNEGIGIYLNGTDLPQEIYQQCDVNHVIEEFHRLLNEEGTMHGYWEGGAETAIYFYGRSFDAMKARLNGFISSYPLCQRARVEQIA
jgi:hypothetical protein